MNKIYAFFMAFLAGISTLLGVIPIYVNISKNVIKTLFIISFISLMFISIFELIPDGYNLIIKENNTIITIITIIFTFTSGIILTYILDLKLGKGSSLFKIGILDMIAMILHNVLEGCISFLTISTNFKLGMLICFMIMMHNIPEGLIISLPIYYSKKNRGLALFLTFISGMSELFGAILSFLFIYRYLSYTLFGLMYIFTAGIMIYVALFEILPIIYKDNILNLH